MVTNKRQRKLSGSNHCTAQHSRGEIYTMMLSSSLERRWTKLLMVVTMIRPDNSTGIKRNKTQQGLGLPKEDFLGLWTLAERNKKKRDKQLAELR